MIAIYVYLYLICQMSAIWIIYRISKNPSVVDVSWSLGIMVAGLIYLVSAPHTLRMIISAVLLLIWSLRLAVYLWFTRIRHGHVDKRYTQLSDGWKMNKSLGFFFNFQLQGLLIFIVASVFYFISQTSAANLSWFDTVAIIIILTGIVGESLADLQLQRFKSQHQKQVCDVGLWRYSRHPNYFFDWIVWCGFALFSLRFTYGYIGLIAPVLMYIIFNYITGPMTERGSIQSRGQAFINYQHHTAKFFPWFKR